MNTITRLGLLCLILTAAAQASPKWTQNPIQLPEVKSGMAVSVNLAPFVVNDSGSALTFKKTAGAAFLTLSQAGVLSGTPSATDVGTHSFRVSVSDGEAGALAVVNLSVAKVAEPPVFPLTCESGDKAHFIGKTNNGEMIYSCAVSTIP